MPFLGGFSPALIHAQSVSVFAVGQNITKTATDSVTISDSDVKLITKVRSISETITIGEALANLIAKVRALAAQTITIAEDIDILVTPPFAGTAIEKSLSETELVSESSGRLKAVWRLQPP